MKTVREERLMKIQEAARRHPGIRETVRLAYGAILAILILGALPAHAQETITTIAGNGTRGFSGDGGQGKNASLSLLYAGGIAADGHGNLYIADTGNNRVRRVSPDGTITTIAGNGIGGFSGDRGMATSAALRMPSGLAIDAGDNLYILDRGNQRIRKITADGIITTAAGNGTTGYGGDGGPATQAMFNFGSEAGNCAVDKTGNLYIPDTANDRIRKVDPAGMITTLTETHSPYSVAVNAAGDVYFGNGLGVVTRIKAQGGMEIVAGGESQIAPDNLRAVNALLVEPSGVAVDSTGNLYITDSRLQQLRKVSPYGTITRLAGSPVTAVDYRNGVTGGFSGDGGPPQRSQLNVPFGVAVGRDDCIYVADSGNDRIRRIAASSVGPDAWTPASSNLADSDIRALAIDPFDPDTIYAGSASHGVFKSTNAGADWSQIGLQDVSVNVLVADQSHSGTLFVGTNGKGLLKSSDGGATWSSTGPDFPYISALTIDPRNPSILLAGHASGIIISPSALFKSTDGGESWSRIQLPVGSTDSMTIDPVEPNVIYVITGSEMDLNFLWKSTDWGESWTGIGLNHQMALWQVVVDPTNPDTVYGEGDDLGYRSVDGAETWAPYDLPVAAIAADPAGTLYSMSAGMVYRSADSGATWSRLNEGLADVAQALAVAGSNPGTVYTGTYAGGVFKDAAMLTLDRREYCVGTSWKVGIVNAPSGVSIRLVGVSNGVSWDWPGWGTTNSDGTYSASGTFAGGSQGTHLLHVEIGGVRSNEVSLSISDCPQREH